MTPRAQALAQRLTLALDACRCRPSDVARAVELAAVLGASLEGLIVEDADLVRLAELPFAREVGGRSGQGRPLQADALASSLRRRIRQTTQALETEATLRNVPVSHSTARGKVVRQALAQGEHGDLLLFGAGTVPGVGRPAPAGGPLMLWYEDGEAAAPMLDLAVALAQRLRRDLLIGFAARREASELEVRAELSAWAKRLPGRVRMHPLHGAPAQALIAAARACGAAHVMVHAQASVASVDILEELVAGLASSVIVVR